MFRRKPAPDPKGYLVKLAPSGQEPCGCAWEPLGLDPFSIVTGTVLVREDEVLPPVRAGHVRYCPTHGGAA